LRLLGGVETDAHRRVAFGHGPAGPSTSKWTSCLNACTRASTSAGVTLSNPWMPNASTANDPIAAPYTIARRRFGGERSPFLARWDMKPPANASPAPVGSNTSWRGWGGTLKVEVRLPESATCYSCFTNVIFSA